MEIHPIQKFPEVLIFKGQRFKDDRGFFLESYRKSTFEYLPEFVQENHSFSECGVFRGLHYQLNPKAQGKLVYCVSGVIEDFVVDIRKGSPTYGQWEVFYLDSREANDMVWVPPGFAHGFYTVEDANVIYKVTEYWSPEHERCIRWNDPDIGIQRFQGYTFKPIKLSDKDEDAPLLKKAENNFVYDEKSPFRTKRDCQ